MEKEVINLERADEELLVNNIQSVVPSESPRYHFYLFKHTHEGDYMEKIGEHA